MDILDCGLVCVTVNNLLSTGHKAAEGARGEAKAGPTQPSLLNWYRLTRHMLPLAVAALGVLSMATTYGPSSRAVALQDEITSSIARGAASVSIAAGDYYFGNTTLAIHHAHNLTLRAAAGPGTVQLWFTIGSGLLVNQSRNLVLDGLTIDYDPPSHWQGTILHIADSGTGEFEAVVKTDPGYLAPDVFDEAYCMGVPGIQTGPAAMVWNSSDPGFGSFASASWPPTSTAGGHYLFKIPQESVCKDIQFAMTDGSSCLGDEATRLPKPQDKVTAHIRAGFTLHILNSSHVHTQHTAIHGAPGFAITEYDGLGQHSYVNVSVGRRHDVDSRVMCGIANPTGGRLCLGLISSSNDALHSSGCKHGPSFTGGELSYALDDWVNVHSRAQVVLERIDARHLIMIDPRLNFAESVADDFPYGNAETLTNARQSDTISFFLSGNLTTLGSAKVRSTRRATWEHDAETVERAQQLLDTRYKLTCGLDAGSNCRKFGCAPRVWRVAFETDLPSWSDATAAIGVVANLDSWTASGAVVKDSHLHHGRFGVRWKSSDAVFSGNRVSARYMELSPLEYYLEGPFRLNNITVANNTFSDCVAPAASFAKPSCAQDTHLPLGYWRKWCSYGGGCGGVCKAASVGASELRWTPRLAGMLPLSTTKSEPAAHRVGAGGCVLQLPGTVVDRHDRLRPPCTLYT